MMESFFVISVMLDGLKSLPPEMICRAELAKVIAVREWGAQR
jgi:hypothetical protein